ncbi:hypothetical protein ACEWY4_004785 [Coilia grayii]|uniref:Sperm-associated antigen 8 n=1 Tax=Coilia grayii TaxID=363190 RepID=A0ABD1KML1_9TELE
MDVSDDSLQHNEVPVGKCLLDNWVEERATALLDNSMPRVSVHKNGHRGILTLDVTAKVQGMSTVKSSYVPPKGPGVRQRGQRGELLEKHLYQKISARPTEPAELSRHHYFQVLKNNTLLSHSEQVQAELNLQPPVTDFSSTTHTDYMAEGFQPAGPSPAQVYDSKTERAITFWNENYHRLQGVTTVSNRDAPFRKNSSFSKPISEQLDNAMLSSAFILEHGSAEERVSEDLRHWPRYSSLTSWQQQLPTRATQSGR